MEIIRHQPENSIASGPYHPAVEVREGNLKQLYVSGQGTINPRTGKRELGGMRGQATAAMDNLKNVIEGSGFTMDDIVKVTLYLVEIGDSKVVNEVYREYFSAGCLPARSIVGVRELPGGQSIEIDAVAVRRQASD
ncbi:MAG: RidA family protein [Cyclonatronaceae bacterium]